VKSLPAVKLLLERYRESLTLYSDSANVFISEELNGQETLSNQSISKEFSDSNETTTTGNSTQLSREYTGITNDSTNISTAQNMSNNI
jgi:hypothetical protein